MPNVNFNEAEKRDAVADGEYLCRVKNVILKTTKTDREMWTLWLVIEQEGDYYGKILFHNLVFSPGSLWMVKHFYEAALGHPMEGEHNCQTNNLLDTYVIVTVKGKSDYGPNLTYFKAPQGMPTSLKQPSASDDDIPF